MQISEAPSPDRIEKDIKKLVSFGTRHTLSDTVSTTRGIGAARRWIKSEFDNISAACDDCLEVSFQRSLVPAVGNKRIPQDTWGGECTGCSARHEIPKSLYYYVRRY